MTKLTTSPYAILLIWYKFIAVWDSKAFNKANNDIWSSSFELCPSWQQSCMWWDGERIHTYTCNTVGPCIKTKKVKQPRGNNKKRYNYVKGTTDVHMTTNTKFHNIYCAQYTGTWP